MSSSLAVSARIWKWPWLDDQISAWPSASTRATRVRLDIGLVHRGGLELLLDHHVGLGEARVEIADVEFEPLGDVGRLGRRRLDAAGDHVLEQQRRVVRHRLVDVDDVRQHLVVDLDQRGASSAISLLSRGDGGDGVALRTAPSRAP